MSADGTSTSLNGLHVAGTQYSDGCPACMRALRKQEDCIRKGDIGKHETRTGQEMPSVLPFRLRIRIDISIGEDGHLARRQHAVHHTGRDDVCQARRKADSHQPEQDPHIDL